MKEQQISWLGLERSDRQRLRPLRRQFVINELPQFEVDNEELGVGFTKYQMLRALWIKSRRLLKMQGVTAQEPVQEEDTVIEKAS